MKQEVFENVFKNERIRFSRPKSDPKRRTNLQLHTRFFFTPTPKIQYDKS